MFVRVCQTYTMESKMATQKTIPAELFLAWLQRFKEITGLTEDQEVAEALGITPGTLSARKKAGSIPHRLVIDWCREHHRDVNDLFQIETSSAKLRGDDAVIQLVERVVEAVEKRLIDTDNEMNPKGKAKFIGDIVRIELNAL